MMMRMSCEVGEIYCSCALWAELFCVVHYIFINYSRGFLLCFVCNMHKWIFLFGHLLRREKCCAFSFKLVQWD